MKKVIFLVILLIVGFSGYLYNQIPKEKIKSLKDGYVSVKFEDGMAKYKITNKRPRHWVHLSKIFEPAYKAIVVSEDWYFYEHHGVDISQVKEAIGEGLDGKRLRGASTISQQVVKNLFLSNERSLWRKVRELADALYMERHVNKEKILEIYLNIIEFGEGIYGIGNASKYYFNKSPRELTAKEGAFLAMLLPNPKQYAESFRQRKLTDYAKSTIKTILEKMAKAGHLDKSQVDNEFKKLFHWERKKRAKRNAAFKPEKVKVKRSKKKWDDGSGYEKRYKVDKDLILSEEPEIDPNAILDDESGYGEEFSVD